jgi:hypothetical protein
VDSATQVGEFAVTAFEKSANFAIGGVVVVDQRRKTGDLFVELTRIAVMRRCYWFLRPCHHASLNAMLV